MDLISEYQKNGKTIILLPLPLTSTGLSAVKL
jgi:hypothetical protein